MARSWVGGRFWSCYTFAHIIAVPKTPLVDTLSLLQRENSKSFCLRFCKPPSQYLALDSPGQITSITMMMMVGLLARAARGSRNNNKNKNNNHSSHSQLPQRGGANNYYRACPCCGGQQQQQPCAQCAQYPPSAPTSMPRRDLRKREHRHERRERNRVFRSERRAFKAERKAARRGYSGGGGSSGNGHAAPVLVHAQYPPPQTLAPQEEGRDARRASFDVRDLEREDSGSESDAPPEYEQGNWQRPPVSHRRSVEVLTPDKRMN